MGEDVVNRPEGRQGAARESNSLLLDKDYVEADEENPCCLKCPEQLTWYAWGILICVDIIGPFSSDTYIPNIPDMERELHSSHVLTGLTLQVNWLALGVGTIIAGSAADNPRFGRKGTMLIAMCFYVVGTLGSSTANNVQVLIFFRFIQGLGEAASVVTSAVARDVVQDFNERLRVLSVLGSLRPVAIVIAPTIGGIIGSIFSWRLVFLALAIWGISLVLGILFFIPETIPPTARSRGFEGYGYVLKKMYNGESEAHRLAFGATLVYAIGFGGVYAWSAIISIVLELYYNLSVIESSIIISSVPLLIILINFCIGCLFREETTTRTRMQSNEPCESEDFSAISLIGPRSFPERKRSISPSQHLAHEYDKESSPLITTGSRDGIKPVSFLHFALIFMNFAIITSLSLLFTSLLESSWLYFVGNMCVFVIGQSATIGTSQAIVLEPYMDHAGVASSINNFIRTVVGSAFSFMATNFVSMYDAQGFLYVLILVCITAQVSWIWLFPSSSSSSVHP